MNEPSKKVVAENVKSKTIETKKASKIVSAKKIATPKKVDIIEAEKKVTDVVKPATTSITFQLKFTTQYGQQLFITGNHELLGNNDVAKALPMQYFNNEFWYANLEFDGNNLPNENITYNYLLKSLDGTIQYDCGEDKYFNPSAVAEKELLILDAWNYTGYIENAFYTVPFQDVILKQDAASKKVLQHQKITHIFFK